MKLALLLLALVTTACVERVVEVRTDAASSKNVRNCTTTASAASGLRLTNCYCNPGEKDLGLFSWEEGRLIWACKSLDKNVQTVVASCDYTAGIVKINTSAQTSERLAEQEYLENMSFSDKEQAKSLGFVIASRVVPLRGVKP